MRLIFNILYLFNENGNLKDIVLVMKYHEDVIYYNPF